MSNMPFRRDWLEPVLSVPYAPTLGPVHPRVLSAELFTAVAEIAGTGTFLPYDKDRRWFARKDEQMLVGEVIHTPERTVIPTFASARGGLVKIHYYGTARPDVGEALTWARCWCLGHGATRGMLTWFEGSSENARGRLMLKAFSDADLDGEHSRIELLQDCAVADTFPTFAAQLGVAGFSFLCQRMKSGLGDGAVLVSVEDRHIVGAIGPMSILTDAVGATYQPPQYFAVHPDFRGRGHGRELWRAAMAWGRIYGAEYKILQASAGSAAERLYLSEGLKTVGFVCIQDLDLSSVLIV